MQRRTTPWRDAADLARLTALLSAADPLAAHARLAACAARCDDAAPHAVLATHALLDAIAADRAGGGTTRRVRLLYTCVLVRFVNGFVDGMQKGVVNRAVKAIAGEIGMPAGLVEIRHAGTHGDLPGLDELRGAALEALRWVVDVYWSKQSAVEVIEAASESVTPEDHSELKRWRRVSSPSDARPIGACPHPLDLV